MIRNRVASALFAGLLSLVVVCRSDDFPGEGGAFQARDSAGVEIVESVTPAWDGDGWTVADTPSLVIGRREGDERYLFGDVAGAVVLRGRRIAVLDAQSALIRVYSAKGEHIADWGREGDGPGEFKSPQFLFPYRGDSILVSDIVASRFTILDDEGRFGRRIVPEMGQSFAIEWRQRLDQGDRSVTPDASCCRLWGPLTTGAFLLSYPEMIPARGRGTVTGSVSVAITPDSGGAARLVGTFAGRRYRLGVLDYPARFQFSPWLNMVAGIDGYFATEGDAYSIGEYDTGGRLRRIIRLARGPRPVTDEVKVAHEALLRERIMEPGQLTGGRSREELLRELLAGGYPSHLPAFFPLVVDAEGSIWAGHRAFGAAANGRGFDRNEFFVFRSDGRHLGVVELPLNVWAFQIGADFILGRASDDLGVEYVHLYRIEK